MSGPTTTRPSSPQQIMLTNFATSSPSRSDDLEQKSESNKYFPESDQKYNTRPRRITSADVPMRSPIYGEEREESNEADTELDPLIDPLIGHKFSEPAKGVWDLIMGLLFQDCNPFYNPVKQEDLYKAMQENNYSLALSMVQKIVVMDHDFKFKFKFKNRHNDKDKYIIETSLVWAVLNKQKDIAINILDKDDFNNAFFLLERALSAAVDQGNLEMAELLIRNKANINFKNQDENSYLILSIQKRYIQLSEYFIKATKIDLNIKNKKGGTALTTAIIKKDKDSAKLLIENKKTNLSIVNKNGENALKLSLKRAEMDDISELIIKSERADLTVIDEDIYNYITLAAERNNSHIIELLINEYKRVNVDGKDSDGNTPLTWSILNFYSSTARLLIEIKADLNTQNAEGNTPLMCALIMGNLSVVKLLLDAQDIKVDIVNKKGENALFLALQRRYFDIAKLLVEKNANLELKDAQGNTPLAWAVNTNTVEMVKLFIEKKADLNSQNAQGNTPLICAIINEDIETSELFIKDKETNLDLVNKKGENALICAVKNDQNIIAESILKEERTDLNTRDKEGNTVLSLVLDKRDFVFAKLIIKIYKKVDPAGKELECNSLLTCALENELFEIADFLMQQGTINHNESSLIVASYLGNLEKVESLIKEGFDVHFKGINKGSALYYALLQGHNDIVELLMSCTSSSAQPENESSILIAAIRGKNNRVAINIIQEGINLNTPDQDENTPFLWAAQAGNKEIFELLISRCKEEIDFNYCNKDGDTALILSIKNKHPEIAEMLIEQKADINFENLKGESPLMWAMENDQLDIFQLLVLGGANLYNLKILPYANISQLDITDKYGNPPLMWAIKNPQFKALETLQPSIFKILVAQLIERSPNFNSKIINKVKTENPLILSFKNEQYYIAKLIVKTKKADLDVRDENRLSPLNLALKNRQYDIAKLIIDSGKANLNVPDENRTVPLIWAIENEQFDIFELLVKKGANLDVKDKSGRPALIYFASKGDLEKCQLLVAHGADTSIKDNDNNTPLIASINSLVTIYKKIPLIHFFMKGRVNLDLEAQNNSGMSALMCAVQKGFTQIIQDLIAKGAKVHAANGRGQTALSFAPNNEILSILGVPLPPPNGFQDAASRQVGQLRSLARRNATSSNPIGLQNGTTYFNIPSSTSPTVTLNSNNIIPVSRELAKAKLEVQEILNNLKGSDIKTSLFLSNFVKNGDSPSKIKLLIEAGADVNLQDKDGRSPLFYAVTYGETRNYETVEVLIEAGADVNLAEKRNGRTPLHEAAAYSRVNEVKLLLAKGANVRKLDYKNNSALHSIYSVEIAEELIRAKCPLNTRNDLGDTPLHDAVRFESRLAVAKALIKAKANLNVKNDSGETPICLALSSKQILIAKELIQAGADVNEAQKFRDTPLFLATMEGNIEIINMIIDKVINIQPKALSHAVSKRYYEIIELLIEKGADPSIGEGILYRPALCEAVKMGDIRIIKTLLKAKHFNINAADDSGKTALDHAKYNKFIENLLREHGAKEGFELFLANVSRFFGY